MFNLRSLCITTSCGCPSFVQKKGYLSFHWVSFTMLRQRARRIQPNHGNYEEGSSPAAGSSSLLLEESLMTTPTTSKMQPAPKRNRPKSLRRRTSLFERSVHGSKFRLNPPDMTWFTIAVFVLVTATIACAFLFVIYFLDKTKQSRKDPYVE